MTTKILFESGGVRGVEGWLEIVEEDGASRINGNSDLPEAEAESLPENPIA